MWPDGLSLAEPTDVLNRRTGWLRPDGLEVAGRAERISPPGD